MTVYTRVNRGAGHKQRRFTSPPLVAKDHGIMRRLSFRTKFSGTWYNRIGSVMNLTGDVFGRLFGTYHSIGSAKEKEEGRKFTLSGHFDTSPPGKTNSSSENGTPMKWTIQWHQQYGAERATSTWSGVYFAGETGSGEEILTQWLLTRKGESDENDGWVSTSMGNEWFSRLRPSDDVVEKAREFGFVSAHPEP
ncbi:avidin family protein, partial [Favolaschia claudopus]